MTTEKIWMSYPSLPSPAPFRCRKLVFCVKATPAHQHWGVGAAASAVLFLGVGLAAASTPLPPSSPVSVPTLAPSLSPLQDDGDDVNGLDSNSRIEDEEFEKWKSKTFALSVPLTVLALRSSIPPSWVKDFIKSQGRRVRFRLKYLSSLDNIFSQLSTCSPVSDIVTIGDSSLSFAIKNAIIQPLRGVEDQHWFQALTDKWKVYLRRNTDGEIDPHGQIWAAPYRWGTMVIAYKKSKFHKHKLAPIEDWADLWRPELAGRIAMVDSPREVIGVVLKYMGASYNTTNIDLQVTGGKNAVLQNLSFLGKQVRLFDSVHYLKAFGVGDVWVVAGWSSDVLPVAKRMSNVAVIVPKSGSSLWADLWAIPAVTGLGRNLTASRARGPSPLIHQWLDFCLQTARALPFKQEVIPGAIPSEIKSIPVEVPKVLTKNKPKLDTNLIAGVPPPEILTRCEFLEPLSDIALSDYKWLIASMQLPSPGLILRIQHYILSIIRTYWLKPLQR